ncbi:MAG: hypothetical protein JOZ29_15345 [Deltaproteobacteria bacterium]|nr:hypothetical protein [Deltaproteobacteria bacterium]
MDFAANGLVAGRFDGGLVTLPGLLAFFTKVLLLLQDWCVSPVACGFSFLLLCGLDGALLGLLVLPASDFHFAVQSGHMFRSFSRLAAVAGVGICVMS